MGFLSLFQRKQKNTQVVPNFYNTVGEMIGGLMYCAVMKARKRL